jgi:hypothetical protein
MESIGLRSGRLGMKKLPECLNPRGKNLLWGKYESQTRAYPACRREIELLVTSQKQPSRTVEVNFLFHFRNNSKL